VSEGVGGRGGRGEERKGGVRGEGGGRGGGGRVRRREGGREGGRRGE